MDKSPIMHMFFLENFLFIDFKYTYFDDLMQGSKLDELISECKEDLFNRGKAKENYGLVKILFDAVLQEKGSLPGANFAAFLFRTLENDRLVLSDLKVLALDTDLQIAHLAQAALCTIGIHVQEYIENLIQAHPNWKLGSAFLINHNIKNLQGSELTDQLDILVNLSKDTRDPLLLQIFANRFHDFTATCGGWNPENICMNILSLSRFRSESFKMYVNAIKKEGETQNAVFLLNSNFNMLETYEALADLSNLQRELGVIQIDKPLYFQGVHNGFRVFENRSLHNRLMYPLGKDLVAEITPFKATKEQEAKGVEILKEEWKRAPDNLLLQTILNDYLIRKGSVIEARDAKGWVDSLKTEYHRDLNLHMSSVRGALRFAEKREDLLIVEGMIRECEKLGTSPILFLLKALWQSHPLRRDTLPEWYILASVNFKKAFENADSQHVQFLLDHLSRYDKLVEEDQIKCRTLILELLGMS